MLKLVLVLLIFSSLANAASVRSAEDEYYYKKTVNLFNEIDRLNPSWHMGQKVNVPSDFFKASYHDGLELKMFGFSSELNNMMWRSTFKEALADHYPGRSNFQYYLVDSLITEDTNGKVAAAASIIVISKGLGAAIGAVARLGLWAGRLAQGTLIAAPIAGAAITVHEENKAGAKYEESHPKIIAAKNQDEKDAAIDEAVKKDAESIGHFATQLVVDAANEKIQKLQHALKFAKTSSQIAGFQNAIRKLEDIKAASLRNQVYTNQGPAPQNSQNVLPEIVVESVK